LDSSETIGNGHLMRCLTLAEALRTQGAKITFIIQKLPGDSIPYVRSKGFSVIALSRSKTFRRTSKQDTDAEGTRRGLQRLPRVDLLVVDHYGLDRTWESAMRPWVRRLMVIDDLANRKHDCDILLDPNIQSSSNHRYKRLVPADAVCLLGPRYALLRPQFVHGRARAHRVRDGAIQRVLVAFGGTDPSNETEKAVRALLTKGSPSDLKLDVVVGAANPHRQRIQRLCKLEKRLSFHVQVENMAKRMSSADLAIGGGGVMAYERCAMGLPSLVIILSKDQEPIVAGLARRGALKNLGWYSRVTAAILRKEVRSMRSHAAAVRQMSRKALQVMRAGTRSGVEQVIAVLRQRVPEPLNGV
jgi:UDP-2,4-diacetamido-2,4,6-trideoxy-beta-L-altropyranose hydrolase